MMITGITSDSPLWQSTIQYADSCSWKAGYCTFAETDSLPDVDYYPFIGFVFVDENFRGERLSQKLINKAIDYAGELRFRNIYIISGEIGPYEKTGSYGNREQVFIREI